MNKKEESTIEFIRSLTYLSKQGIFMGPIELKGALEDEKDSFYRGCFYILSVLESALDDKTDIVEKQI